MKCPICDKHMAIITIVDYFNAHCPSEQHRCWGKYIRNFESFYGPHEYLVHGVEIRKRVKNRKVFIRYMYLEKYYEIALMRKKKNYLEELVKIKMSEEEYKEKYENEPRSLLKLLEVSEVFQ